MCNKVESKSKGEVICIILDEAIRGMNCSIDEINRAVKTCFFIPILLNSEKLVGFVSKAWYSKRTGDVVGELTLVTPVSDSYMFVPNIAYENGHMDAKRVDAFIPKPCYVQL